MCARQSSSILPVAQGLAETLLSLQGTLPPTSRLMARARLVGMSCPLLRRSDQKARDASQLQKAIASTARRAQQRSAPQCALSLVCRSLPRQGQADLGAEHGEPLLGNVAA